MLGFQNRHTVCIWISSILFSICSHLIFLYLCIKHERSFFNEICSKNLKTLRLFTLPLVVTSAVIRQHVVVVGKHRCRRSQRMTGAPWTYHVWWLMMACFRKDALGDKLDGQRHQLGVWFLAFQIINRSIDPQTVTPLQ